MRALCFALAFFAVLTGARASAHAQEAETGGIALLSLEISGDAPPELRKQVQAHIAKGLASSGRVLGLEETRERLADTPELIGCFSSECLERMGELLSVHLFVRAVLTTGGAHYELTLELLQSGEETLVRNSTQTSCSICTIEDLNERSTEAAIRLLVLDTTKHMTVTIASIPDGATISIDGLEAGRSPVTTELEPGPHRISAVAEGFADTAKTVEVAAGVAGEQRFELPMIAPLGTDHEGPGRHYGNWKWGGVATSGVLLALGTTLILLDDGDSPTCGTAQNPKQCKFIRHTQLGGVLALSGAVLTGAATGWMFWSESRHENYRYPTLRITTDGATAGVAFGF